MTFAVSEKNFDIRFNKHYKLYVLLKDKIIFESELRKNGIKYNLEIDEQPFIDGGIRYFLLESDMQKIDQIVVKNEIVANIESQFISDFRDEKKTIKMYLNILGTLVGIIILIILIGKVFG